MGNSNRRHVCHSPQHASSPVYVSIPEPRALAVDALSRDLHGRLIYMFPQFPLLNKVIQKLRTTQEGDLILIAPWWLSHRHSHIYYVCVWTTYLSSFRTAGTYCHNKNIAGFSKEVSRLTAAPRRPSTNRMYDDRWLCFSHWAAGQGIDPLGPTAAQITSLILMAWHLKLSKDTVPA